jgi:predicted RNA-binding protein YlqC (UPF0109 family)
MRKIFVIVASNEHAAEVIGNNGYKIKKIATLTKTFIHCPRPTDFPIFEIKGYIWKSVFQAKKMIQEHADHFDDMKMKKRSIKDNDNDKVRTLLINKSDVAVIIGRKGKQIKKIMCLSHTKIISPDTNKAPIFIISGCEYNIKMCIFWMKLTVFCANRRSYFNSDELRMLIDYLNVSDDKNQMIAKTKFIVNAKRLKNIFRHFDTKKMMEVIMRNDVRSATNFLYHCWNCKRKTSHVARGLCKHLISCDDCIAILNKNWYLRCHQCCEKIESFVIERF